MKKGFTSIVLDTAFRVLVPFTLVYGVYVLIFGEYGPGGGFQAGTALSVGVILSKLIQGNEKAKFNIRGSVAVILAGVGGFIYALVGYITMISGGKFLEYEFLPLAVHELTELHVWGILGIEIGVTLTVMTTFIAIFSALTGEEGPFRDA